MVGQDPRDSTSIGFPGEIARPTASAWTASASACREELTGEGVGIEPGVLEAFDATLKLAEELGATRPDLPPAARAARAERLLRARAGRGVLEPRPLRRRALRRARRERRPRRDVHEDPQRGLRRRGQAAHHARHLLAVQRLLRRLLRPRPARAHEDRRGLPRRPSRTSTSSSRRPRRPSPSSSARRPPTRWRCTSTTTARCRCRSPGSRRSRSPTG